ncbi:MAG: DUF4262 domain-containing protein [Burkholderiaceae bacterium]
MPTYIPNQPGEPPEQLHEKLRDRIGRKQWTVLEVLPDRSGPVFYYTVGLTARGLPELVVFGLDPETGQKALENIAGMLVEGMPPSDGTLLHNVLRNVPVTLRDIPDMKTQMHMRYASEFFPDGVRGMQVIWPDTAGHFPWQQDYDSSMAVYQRLLTNTIH